MKNDCPCIGCTPETGRTPFCHGKGKCEKWESWSKKHLEEKEAIQKYEAETRAQYTIAATRKHFKTLKNMDWLCGGPKK